MNCFVTIIAICEAFQSFAVNLAELSTMQDLKIWKDYKSFEFHRLCVFLDIKFSFLSDQSFLFALHNINIFIQINGWDIN